VRPRVPSRLAPDVPDREVLVVVPLDRVVVVVEDEDVVAADAERGRVVVVVDDFEVPLRMVVVVVDDLLVDRVVEPFAVVVVVDDLATGFDSFVVGFVVAVAFFAVVDVVAFGTLGSSLAPASSSARAAPAGPGGETGGDPGGGGIRSSRRAYCMIRENTGAET
jgi:hypothetical protein